MYSKRNGNKLYGIGILNRYPVLLLWSCVVCVWSCDVVVGMCSVFYESAEKYKTAFWLTCCYRHCLHQVFSVVRCTYHMVQHLNLNNCVVSLVSCGRIDPAQYKTCIYPLLVQRYITLRSFSSRKVMQSFVSICVINSNISDKRRTLKTCFALYLFKHCYRPWLFFWQCYPIPIYLQMTCLVYMSLFVYFLNVFKTNDSKTSENKRKHMFFYSEYSYHYISASCAVHDNESKRVSMSDSVFVYQQLTCHWKFSVVWSIQG